MAYVDGEVDAATREKIEAALQSDPELRARAAIFEATGRSIADVFDPILSHPLSQQQERIPVDAGKEGSAVPTAHEQNLRPANFLRRLSSLFETPTPFSLAVALSAVFVGGLGLGLLMNTGLVPDSAPGTDLVAYRDDGLVATGSLNQTLETLGSGLKFAKSISGGQELVIKPILTFRDQAGRFCREYEILYPAASRFAGLACRTGEANWSVLVHTQVASQPASGNETAVASGGGLETIDAVVERIIEGDALHAEQETSLINKGWRDRD